MNNIEHISETYYLNKKEVSVPFLQFKCKISHEKAKEIYDKIQKLKKECNIISNEV